MSMRVRCAVCKKNEKVYAGIPPNDTTSWVCGPCYNSSKRRITNLKSTVDELNHTITRLNTELDVISEVFASLGQEQKEMVVSLVKGVT